MFFFSLLLLTSFQMIFKWNHFSLKVGIFCLRIIFTCVHRPLCQSVCGIPPFSQNKQDNYFMANNKWRIHATWENHTHSMRAVNLLFLCVFLSSVIFFFILRFLEASAILAVRITLKHKLQSTQNFFFFKFCSHLFVLHNCNLILFVFASLKMWISWNSIISCSLYSKQEVTSN